jgi:hypothetical protein
MRIPYRNPSFTGRIGLTARTRVLGYGRVSTSEQADSGAGLGSQRAAIRLACEQRGWELVGVVEDAGFGAATLARPGITEAFDAGGGEAPTASLARSWTSLR